jgi:23S rRNA pseudouridine2604 synthase
MIASMATLKLSSSTRASETENPVAKKTPLRPRNPSRRDRSLSATKATREARKQAIEEAQNAIIQTGPARTPRPPKQNDSGSSPFEKKAFKKPFANKVESNTRSKPARLEHASSALPKTARPFNKPSAPSNPDQPRLSKRMTELGLCSRREADEWISHGWVRVNGQVVDTLGARVSPKDEITVSKEAHQHQAETVTFILNKPIGYVSGQAEDGHQPAVVLIHPDDQWEEDPLRDKRFKRGFLQGLAPAGRLDIDSTGLLVLTQDGRIAKQLIGEHSSVEKEYLVRVEGQLSEDGLKRLNFGLTLDGVKLKPAKVSWQNEDQLRFVLREGRKRQIRRMCEIVGLKVIGLKRVRIGSVTLGRLPLGKWRYLAPHERF